MEMLDTRSFDMLLLIPRFIFCFVLFSFVFKSVEVRTFEHLVITPRYVSLQSGWHFHLWFFFFFFAKLAAFGDW